MNSLSLFALSTALASLVLLGCERHSFDSTKRLHGAHGAHHDEAHGEEHGEAEKAHGEPKPEEAKAGKGPEEPRKTGI